MTEVRPLSVAVALVAVVLLAPAVLAFPGTGVLTSASASVGAGIHSGRAGVEVNGGAAVDVNGGRMFGRHGMAAVEHAYGRVYQVIEKHLSREQIRSLRRMGISPEDLAARVAERLKHVRARVSADIVRRWHMAVGAYRSFVDSLRETTVQFRTSRAKWEHYRVLYQRGEIDENTYFRVSKDFVLSALDVAIARLEVAKSNLPAGMDLNVSGIDAAIANLEKIRGDVQAARDLNELRDLYEKEVLPAIHKDYSAVFTRVYLMATLRASDSILNQLDLAAARLTALVQTAKDLNVYSADVNSQVTKIFTDIEVVKSELNALDANVQSGKISSVRDYMAQLRQIREQMMAIYREISDLYRQIAHQHVAVRTRVEVHSTEHSARPEIESNVEVNA